MSSVMTIIGAVTTILLFLAYSFLWYNKTDKITKIFTIWLIFSVTIALMPLIFNAIVIILLADSKPEISSILAKGELLIISVAIGSEAIGRILASEKGHNIYEIVSAGGGFVLVLLSSFLFAFLSAPLEIAMNTERVTIVSHIIFLMTMFTSGSCVLLSEVYK